MLPRTFHRFAPSWFVFPALAGVLLLLALFGVWQTAGVRGHSRSFVQPEAEVVLRIQLLQLDPIALQAHISIEPGLLDQKTLMSLTDSGGNFISPLCQADRPCTLP